jgi:cellulose synthase/poly-beta-1,6-N-acetylglucosamine synthase-like glycosyltransferase
MNRVAAGMWGSLALIAWTHAGYPLAAAAAARRSAFRPSPDDGHLPPVTLVIAAHDEERVIRARLQNALALDYPPERLEVVVSLDGSTDGTRAIVEEHAGRGVRLLVNERGGKVAAQNAAVRATTAPVLAFSDANSMWAPDALRRLVVHLADPAVGYVCGRLRLVEPGTGRNVEGRYWRFELWLREQESRLGSITAGNGAIYVVRRSAYLDLKSTSSHDIGLPFRLRRRGFRSLYEPAAVAEEPVAPTTAQEWPRKVRMLSRAWGDVLRGGMLRPGGQPAGYFAALLSHRLLRYAAGPLHLVLVGCTLGLAPASRPARLLLAGHAAWLALALAGRRGSPRVPGADLAWYYLVVTAASVAGLARMLREGPQATWEPAEGTR